MAGGGGVMDANNMPKQADNRQPPQPTTNPDGVTFQKGQTVMISGKMFEVLKSTEYKMVLRVLPTD